MTLIFDKYINQVIDMQKTPREKAMEILKPPFKFECGYIFDSAPDQNMVADDHDCETGTIARLRGWGRLGKLDDGDAIQDAIGQIIADALTKYFENKS
jgi:hypothetical protein